MEFIESFFVLGAPVWAVAAFGVVAVYCGLDGVTGREDLPIAALEFDVGGHAASPPSNITGCVSPSFWAKSSAWKRSRYMVVRTCPLW